MPPLYRWENEEGNTVDVARSFSEIDQEPTEEEFENAEKHIWTRVLAPGITKLKGDNWGPGKGNWLIPLTFIGGTVWNVLNSWSNVWL